MEQTRGLFCTYDSGVARCEPQHHGITFANDLNVQSVLHGQVSLAAVNQSCVIPETMKDCKNLKIH